LANYPTWVASLTVRDGAQRASTIQFRVPEVTAKLYFAAVDKAARDATAIGLLFAAFLTLTSGVEQMRSVTVMDETAPVTYPAEAILRGNKIVVGYHSGAQDPKITVPARDATAYTQKEDSIEIDITAAGDFADWITLFESTALGPQGLAVEVFKAYLND